MPVRVHSPTDAHIHGRNAFQEARSKLQANRELQSQPLLANALAAAAAAEKAAKEAKAAATPARQGEKPKEPPAKSWVEQRLPTNRRMARFLSLGGEQDTDASPTEAEQKGKSAVCERRPRFTSPPPSFSPGQPADENRDSSSTEAEQKAKPAAALIERGQKTPRQSNFTASFKEILETNQVVEKNMSPRKDMHDFDDSEQLPVHSYFFRTSLASSEVQHTHTHTHAHTHTHNI
jgi:hypothetical protein